MELRSTLDVTFHRRLLIFSGGFGATLFSLKRYGITKEETEFENMLTTDFNENIFVFVKNLTTFYREDFVSSSLVESSFLTRHYEYINFDQKYEIRKFQ